LISNRLYVIVKPETTLAVAISTSGRPDLRQVVAGTPELPVVQLRSSNVLDPQVEEPQCEAVSLLGRCVDGRVHDHGQPVDDVTGHVGAWVAVVLVQELDNLECLL